MIQENIDDFNRDVDQSEATDDQVEILSNFLSKHAKTVFNKKIKQNDKINNRPRYWMDNSCVAAKSDYKKARNELNKNNSSENRKIFIKAKNRYQNTRKRARKKFIRNEAIKLETIAKTDPRNFWKSIRKTKTANKIDTDYITLKDFHEHFKNLFEKEEVAQSDYSLSNSSISDPDLDRSITEDELKKAVFAQNNGKSPGPDDISAEIIKASYPIIQPYLLNIFQSLFENSLYPESWSLGYIVPIFKGGDKTDPKNYRGITINNILSKVYSQIIYNRLKIWNEKYENLNECQFGYQKNKSTIDCIFIFHSIICKVLNSGKKLYTAFIDYEKCFDKVNRAFLWQKLVRQGVTTKLVNAIKAMYSSVKCSIKFNDQISAPMNSLSGLKQGDSNSSLLFIMFVNDIIDNIKYDLDDIFTIDQLKLFLLLFADDQALFSTSPSSLQSMLTDIEKYCDKWHLQINTKKLKL